MSKKYIAQNIPVGDTIKLMLCTRDIGVGDTFYIFKHLGVKDGSYDVCTKVEENDIHSRADVYSRFGCVKTVGEIPKECMWIKEDDQLDEEDIRILCECEMGTECGYLYGADYCYAPHDIHILQFKCPCCNTYFGDEIIQQSTWTKEKHYGRIHPEAPEED